MTDRSMARVVPAGLLAAMLVAVLGAGMPDASAQIITMNPSPTIVGPDEFLVPFHMVIEPSSVSRVVFEDTRNTLRADHNLDFVTPSFGLGDEISLSIPNTVPANYELNVGLQIVAEVDAAANDGSTGRETRTIQVPYTVHPRTGNPIEDMLTITVRIVRPDTIDPATHMISVPTIADSFTISFGRLTNGGSSVETVTLDDDLTALTGKGIVYREGASSTSGDMVSVESNGILSFGLTDKTARTETLGYSLSYPNSIDPIDDTGTITLNIVEAHTITQPFTFNVGSDQDTFVADFGRFITENIPDMDAIIVTKSDLMTAGLGIDPTLTENAADAGDSYLLHVGTPTTFSLTDQTVRTAELPFTVGARGALVSATVMFDIMPAVGTAGDHLVMSTYVAGMDDEGNPELDADESISLDFRTFTGGRGGGTVTFVETRDQLAARGLDFDTSGAFGGSVDADGVITADSDETLFFDITIRPGRVEFFDYTLEPNFDSTTPPTCAEGAASCPVTPQTGTITHVFRHELTDRTYDATYDVVEDSFRFDPRDFTSNSTAGDIVFLSHTPTQLQTNGLRFDPLRSNPSIPGNTGGESGMYSTGFDEHITFIVNRDAFPASCTLTIEVWQSAIDGTRLRSADMTGENDFSVFATVNLRDPPESRDSLVDATNAGGMVDFALDFDPVYCDVHDDSSPRTVVTFYTDSTRGTATTLAALDLSITGDTATENTDGTITIMDPDGMATFTSTNQDTRTIYASYTATVTPPNRIATLPSLIGMQMGTGEIAITVPPSPSVTREVDHGDFTVDFGGILGDLAGRTISFTVRGEGPLSDEDLEIVSGATEVIVGEGETSYNVETGGMVVLRSTSATERSVILDYRVTGTNPTNGDITLNINVPPEATAITITRDNANAFSLDFKDHFSDADETDETTHMITFTFDGTATAATSGLGISGADLASGTYTVTDPANTIQFTVTETTTRTVALSYTVQDANSNTDDTGTIAISIDIPPPPPTCENSQAKELTFGSLEDGGTSDEQTLAIRNSGNTDSTIMIRATDWTAAGATQMAVGQTRVGTETGDYDSKTALTTEDAELFSLTAGESSNAFLQLRAQLADPEYEGGLSQTINITSTCGDAADGTATETTPAALTEAEPRTAASTVEGGQAPAEAAGTAPAGQTPTDTAPTDSTPTDTAASTPTDTAPAGQTPAAGTQTDTAPADPPTDGAASNPPADASPKEQTPAASQQAGAAATQTQTDAPTDAAPADTTPPQPADPTITAPPDTTIEATGPLTVLTDALTGTATATDEGGIPPTITHDRQASYPLGKHTITYTATDQDGNTATAAQLVTIQDTTSPTFTTTPAGATQTSADGSAIPITFTIPAASDLVDQDVEVTSSHAPGSDFEPGTTKVTFTATDDSGNKVTFEISITVTVPQPASTFEEGFESGTSSWVFSDDKDWSASTPHAASVSHELGTMVLSSSNCNTTCTATLATELDTTKPLAITFDRFIDSHVDGLAFLDGLAVFYQPKGSDQWLTAGQYNDLLSHNTNIWESESITLNIQEDSAKLRFSAYSSHDSKFVEIDNIRIAPLS